MENKHIAFVTSSKIPELSDGDILKSFDLIITKDKDIPYYLDDNKNLIPNFILILI